MSGMWKRSHGRTSEAPPHERGGYRYVRPTATAPHLDSTPACAFLAEFNLFGHPADAMRQAAITNSCQFFEQRLCFCQIRGIEAFGEPAVDRGEKLTRLCAPALL